MSMLLMRDQIANMLSQYQCLILGSWLGISLSRSRPKTLQPPYNPSFPTVQGPAIQIDIPRRIPRYLSHRPAQPTFCRPSFEYCDGHCHGSDAWYEYAGKGPSRLLGYAWDLGVLHAVRGSWILLRTSVLAPSQPVSAIP